MIFKREKQFQVKVYLGGVLPHKSGIGNVKGFMRTWPMSENEARCKKAALCNAGFAPVIVAAEDE